MLKLIQKIIGMKIFRFGTVGMLGSATNLVIFFIFVDLFQFPKNIIAIICFIIAASQNYLLNHLWTFNEHIEGEKPSLQRYLKFLLTSVIGLLINLTVLNIITIFIELPFSTIAQGIGILAGMIFNFIGSKLFVFRKAA